MTHLQLEVTMCNCLHTRTAHAPHMHHTHAPHMRTAKCSCAFDASASIATTMSSRYLGLLMSVHSNVDGKASTDLNLLHMSTAATNRSLLCGVQQLVCLLHKSLWDHPCCLQACLMITWLTDILRQSLRYAFAVLHTQNIPNDFMPTPAWGNTSWNYLTLLLNCHFLMLLVESTCRSRPTYAFRQKVVITCHKPCQPALSAMYLG